MATIAEQVTVLEDVRRAQRASGPTAMLAIGTASRPPWQIACYRTGSPTCTSLSPEATTSPRFYFFIAKYLRIYVFKKKCFFTTVKILH